MKYFTPTNYRFSIPAKLQINSTIFSTYLGRKLTQEFTNFYAMSVNLINRVQFQALNNPNFQKLDFKLGVGFKKQLNYYLRTQVKLKGLREAHVASDRLFEAFTPIYSILQDNEQLFSASLYWRRIFEFINKWEVRNNCQVHKGTLFSFWSLAELLAGNSDVGFLLMRKALVEDERYHRFAGVTTQLHTPAVDFIRLDIRARNSFFRNIVKKMRKPLKNRIRVYNSTFNYSFGIKQFQTKLSAVSTLEEATLYFNVAHMRVGRIRQMFKLNLGDTDTARLIFVSSLFDLTKVAEVVVRKSSVGQTNPKHFTIKTFLNNLASHNRWNVNIMILGNEVDNKFSGSAQDIITIVGELLVRNMQLAINQQFPLIIYDCLLLYGLRNYGAHSIDKVPDVFSRNYVEITQRCYNALFFIVDNYQTI